MSRLPRLRVRPGPTWSRRVNPKTGQRYRWQIVWQQKWKMPAKDPRLRRDEGRPETHRRAFRSKLPRLVRTHMVRKNSRQEWRLPSRQQRMRAMKRRRRIRGRLEPWRRRRVNVRFLHKTRNKRPTRLALYHDGSEHMAPVRVFDDQLPRFVSSRFNRNLARPSRRGVSEARRAKVDPFTLPTHVLDLDSEDSHHVRVFNERDEARQKAKWARDPSLEAAMARLDKLQAEASEAKQLSEYGYSPWTPSSCDVLTVALIPVLGLAPETPETPDGAAPMRATRRATYLRKVAQRNGAPWTSPQDLALGLLDAVSRDRVYSQENLHEEFLRAPFKLALSKVKSPDEMWRLLTDVLWRLKAGARVRQSKQLVAAAFDEALALFEPEQLLLDTEETLTALNNMTAHLLGKGLELSRGMCHLGLRSSVACSQFGAARRYLERGHRHGYFKRQDEAPPTGKLQAAEPHSIDVEWMFRHLLTRLPIVMDPEQDDRGRRCWSGRPHSFPSRGQTVRSELYTLLTGYSLVRSDRAPCLADFLGRGPSNRKLRGLYLRMLRELGGHGIVRHLEIKFKREDEQYRAGLKYPREASSVSDEVLYAAAVDLDGLSHPLPS